MSELNHSVKVPRFYKVAAKIAKDYYDDMATIKFLVCERRNENLDLQALFTMVTTLFQKYRELTILLKRSQILKKESPCNPWLIKILIVELLWGKKTLMGQSKPENTVRSYEGILKAELTDLIAKAKKVPYKPQYVRCNNLIVPKDDAIQNFQIEGNKLLEFDDKNDYDGFLKKISTLEKGEFIIDIHIPDLLIFSPSFFFDDHPAYRKVCVFLQDKASCLPVHILAPPPGSIVLDMCAAPGMKTTHIASVMNDQGTVYAVEKYLERYKMLGGTIIDCASTCIKSVHKDILDCTAKDFPGVEYILVDPSCSRTGIVEKYRNRKEISHERLRKLVGLQIKILSSALTRYPDAKRVVYTTSSLKPEENEDVVRQVMEKNIQFKLVPAKQFITGNWKNFGSKDYGELGAYCLYTRPEDDSTNGSFVAVFERLAEGEQNQFFNNKIIRNNIDKKTRKKPKKLVREGRGNGRNRQNIKGDDGIDKEVSHDDKTSEIVKKSKKKKHFVEGYINEENATQETNETEKKKKKEKTKINGKNETNKVNKKKKKLQTKTDSSKNFEKASKESKKKKLVRKVCLENSNEGATLKDTPKNKKEAKEQQDFITEKNVDNFLHNKKTKKKAAVKENLVELVGTQYQQNAIPEENVLEKRKNKRKILEIIENEHNMVKKKKKNQEISSKLVRFFYELN